MNNVILISHEGVAAGMKKAVELILGKQENLLLLELNSENGITHFRDELEKLIMEKASNNHTLIVLADLKYGSPYNCALSVILRRELQDRAWLISGMNLNLVLESLMSDEQETNDEVINNIVSQAQDGIFIEDISSLKNKNSTDDE